MPKKSARSKGYLRKKKNDGFKPIEKLILAGVGVLIVIIILSMWLPDIIQSIGDLEVVDGVVQNVADNELICNLGTTSDPHYRLLATVEALDGYVLSSVEDGHIDDNIHYMEYTAESEDSAAQSYTVQTGNGDAESLTTTYLNSISGTATMIYLDEEAEELTINGHKAWCFVAEYDRSETDLYAEEGEDRTTHFQVAIVYLESNFDDYCVSIQALNSGDSEDAFRDREALRALAISAAEAILIN